MDNLTHTLIGTLLGETVARTSSADEQGLPSDLRRNLLVTLSAVGSNLPDIDLLYSYLGSKVNYLLHHRGHSHTIVGALALSAIAFAVTTWWLKRRKLAASPRDGYWMMGILVAAPLLHVGMDSTNNYGVHPFWPFHNGWFYGDSVFIIEPLLWTAAAPLVFLLRTHVARFIVAIVLALGLALSFLTGLVPIAPAVALSLITAGMLAVAYRTRPYVALMAGISLWIGITGSFIAAAQIAARRTDELAVHLFPETRLLDRVVTPMPANPLCWEITLVQSERQNIALRRAMLSLAPAWIAADGCLGRSFHMSATAPLQPVRLADSAALKWYGEIATPKDQLVRVVADNCAAAAAMLFIRVPWIASYERATVIGDLRYDREAALGFAEIDLDADAARCPKFVPHWDPPRSDVLQ